VNIAIFLNHFSPKHFCLMSRKQLSLARIKKLNRRCTSKPTFLVTFSSLATPWPTHGS